MTRIWRHASPLLVLTALTAVANVTAVTAVEPVKLRPLPALYASETGGGLRHPEGVACGAGGRIAVADTGNGRLLSYALAGDQLVPAPAIRLPELPSPIRVQFDADGGILALDGKLRRIARLTPAGKFLGYVEPPAEIAPGPMIPRSFAVDRAGNLYILDIFGGRIVVLDPGGGLLRRIALPDGAGFFSDIAVDGRGAVYAVDSVGARLYVARQDDAALAPLTPAMRAEMAFPTALAVDPQGRLFIADQHGGGIVIIGPDGSFRGRQAGPGWKEGTLRYPSGLCADGAGTLFVADRENNRIQAFAVSE